MLIQINQEAAIEIAGSSEVLVSQLNETMSKLYASNEIVQEVVIDGYSFREDYESYLIEHIDRVASVQFLTVNGDLWIADLMMELHSYLPRVIKATDSISDCFYGVPSQEDWQSFSLLMEGVTWVYQSVLTIQTHIHRSSTDALSVVLSANLAGFVKELEQILPQVEEGIQQEEHTNVGDLVKYELGPAMERLLKAIETSRGIV